MNLLSWLRRESPGISSNENRRLEKEVYKKNIIKEIEDLIERVDSILKAEEKTNLLKELQEGFPKENLQSLDQVHIDYFRDLLTNIINFLKEEESKAEIN